MHGRKKPVIKMIVCGAVYAIAYILTDLVTGLVTPGYSFYFQTVSELSAIGAPTRIVWQIMAFIHNPLLICCGIGIINLASIVKRKTMKWLGYLIVVWGGSGFVWLLFPMNLRGNIGSANDTMHLVMTGFTVFLMVTIIAVGANVLGKTFRVFSIATLLTMMIFGIITSRQASRVAMQLPTPGMGITERVTSYAPLIWLAVLTTTLSLEVYKNGNT